MRVTVLFSLLLTTALAAPQTDSQALSSDLANWSSLGNALQSLSFNFTVPTKTANLDNISPPPRSLIPEVITALPPSVLMELIIPSQRSALASQFKAGSTPVWYASLPSDVQSYLLQLLLRLRRRRRERLRGEQRLRRREWLLRRDRRGC
ncbi:hypothetical protein CNMCM7691_004970 [Aspergillus felis]|uniref:Uncharacterized protein n=1 Tax=Aspergillus felis TaxID=1287682 RepID=A0A8H6R328_9EURO|nr:hypothetical protein CNMCM7691_004970 [Aspergillus felis]